MQVEPAVGLNRNPTNAQGLSPAALAGGREAGVQHSQAAPNSHPGAQFP